MEVAIINGKHRVSGAIQQRLSDADYRDGINAPAGEDRVGARVISNSVINQTMKSSTIASLVTLFGWDTIDHDIVKTEIGDESMPIQYQRGFFLTDEELEFCDKILLSFCLMALIPMRQP